MAIGEVVLGIVGVVGLFGGGPLVLAAVRLRWGDWAAGIVAGLLTWGLTWGLYLPLLFVAWLATPSGYSPTNDAAIHPVGEVVSAALAIVVGAGCGLRVGRRIAAANRAARQQLHAAGSA